MKRRFVAIDLPDNIQTDVAALCNGISNARWVKANLMHLTLRFIGDADEARAEAIAEGLAAIQPPCFPLTLQGVGTFPPRGAPRVLWVGVAPSEPLVALQARIEAVCQAAGCEPETKRYAPHVTVARFGRHGKIDPDAWLARNRDYRSRPFTVTEYHLFDSRLERGGPTHTRLQTITLALC
jgi:2'-5' RNA ligase